MPLLNPLVRKKYQTSGVTYPKSLSDPFNEVLPEKKGPRSLEIPKILESGKTSASGLDNPDWVKGKYHNQGRVAPGEEGYTPEPLQPDRYNGESGGVRRTMSNVLREGMKDNKLSNMLGILAQAIGPNSMGGRLGAGSLALNAQQTENKRRAEAARQEQKRDEAYIGHIRTLDEKLRSEMNAPGERTVEVEGVGPVPVSQAWHYLDKSKAESPFGKIDTSKYTSESLESFNKSVTTGTPDYSLLKPTEKTETGESLISKISPEHWTSKSIQEFKKTGDYSVLVPSEKKPTPEDSRKRLDSIMSDFRQVSSQLNSIKSGVDIFSPDFTPERMNVVKDLEAQLKNIAIQYSKLGGDVGDLGYQTKQTSQGTFINAGTNEEGKALWLRIK